MRSRSSACACFRRLLCVGRAGSGEDYEGDHKGDASSQDGPPDEVYEQLLPARTTGRLTAAPISPIPRMLSSRARSCPSCLARPCMVRPAWVAPCSSPSLTMRRGRRYTCRLSSGRPGPVAGEVTSVGSRWRSRLCGGDPVRGRRRRRNRLAGGAQPRLNQTGDGPPGRAARVHGVRLCERRARPRLGRTHPARSRRPARPADDRGLLPSVRGERVRPPARGRRLVRLRVAAPAVSSGKSLTPDRPGQDNALVNVLEPGRRRRHPMPLLTRAIWGLAIGLAIAIVIGLVLR